MMRIVLTRTFFLDKAGFDSVFVAKILLEAGDPIESSEYFLSAAYSYEESGASVQAISCFNKLLDIGVDEFLDRAKEGLSRIISVKKDNIDINKREGRIKALDFLVWKNYALTTTQAIESFSQEFNISVSDSSVRNYANILKERKRVLIWGGPQGREYNIFPNIKDLATRKDYYGKDALFPGSIESRVTKDFRVRFETLDSHKELFLINSSIMPKMVIAVDMDAFVQNVERLMTPHFSVKAIGELKRSTDLENNGYAPMINGDLDLLDSTTLYDGITDETIYERANAEVYD
jgi:hypothetical protein